MHDGWEDRVEERKTENEAKYLYTYPHTEKHAIHKIFFIDNISDDLKMMSNSTIL